MVFWHIRVPKNIFFISEANHLSSCIVYISQKINNVFKVGNPVQQVSDYQGTHTNCDHMQGGLLSPSVVLLTLLASGMKSLLQFPLEIYEIPRPYCVYLHLTTEREREKKTLLLTILPTPGNMHSILEERKILSMTII